MKRKIMIFVMALITIGIVVVGSEYVLDWDTNKDMDDWLDDNCDGYETTEECIAETTEDMIYETYSDDQQDTLKNYCNKAIRQCDENDYTCQFFNTHMNFFVKNVDGYTCEEGTDQVTTKLCLSLSSDHHECWQNELETWNITCHNAEWIPLDSEQGNNS